jgi:hypothetical protein
VEIKPDMTYSGGSGKSREAIFHIARCKESPQKSPQSSMKLACAGFSNDYNLLNGKSLLREQIYG